MKHDHVEDVWQKWFNNNPWVLGSEFVKVLGERDIDTDNISDYLMEAYDGFLDIIEIKRPGISLNKKHQKISTIGIYLLMHF